MVDISGEMQVIMNPFYTILIFVTEGQIGWKWAINVMII